MRGRLKPGRRDEFERMFAELAPVHTEHGLISAELAWEVGDPNAFLEIIHFRDRDSYERNAARPQTDADFRRQMEFLEGEPEWIDVEYGVAAGSTVRA
jgi:quinol monooxygenase YgiN